jgi:hypothetical protein
VGDFRFFFDAEVGVGVATALLADFRVRPVGRFVTSNARRDVAV